MKAAIGGLMMAHRRRHPRGYGSHLPVAEYVTPIREDQRLHTSLPDLPSDSLHLFPRGNPTIVPSHFQHTGDNGSPGVGPKLSAAYIVSLVDPANGDLPSTWAPPSTARHDVPHAGTYVAGRPRLSTPRYAHRFGGILSAKDSLSNQGTLVARQSPASVLKLKWSYGARRGLKQHSSVAAPGQLYLGVGRF